LSANQLFVGQAVFSYSRLCYVKWKLCKQDAQLLQRDRAAGCIIVFAKSTRLKLGDNILWTL